MAATNLKLQLILSTLDKVTGPLKKMQGSGIGAGRALKEARDRLKDLNAQQKDISAWRTQRTAAQQTEAALDAARERVRTLGQQMKATGVPTREMARDLKAAIREATGLKREHQQNQIQLQGLRNKLNAAGISTRNLGAGEQALKAKIAATNSELLKQENRLKRVTTQQQRLARNKAQYEKTQALAGGMAATGAGGLATGTGILYAGARMLAPGVQFDADMSKVQALTRLKKDDTQLAALRAQSRQLGADTMFSATDAAQGQGFLAMAGFKPKAILEAMPGMLDLAKAGDSGLAETADIASNILTSMGLEAKDMTRLGDVLVGAFTRSNTNLQMLGETMKYVGPVAASVGQDVETVAAMAGKLGDAGIQGSMGGTALRAILNRLSAPPAAAAKALKKLGISAKDAQGNMRDMPDILTELYNKTKKMGDADRAGVLKHIAGEEAVSALQVLVKQAGQGELQKFIATLRETQGEAAATAKTMGDNLVGDLDELSSAWEDLGIQIQEQQNGPLREITQNLANIVGGVKAWIIENPVLAAQIVKTAAGLGIIMAVMGGITLALASILGPFAMVRFAMMLLGIKSLGLVTALKFVASALLWITRLAMANPIGLLITVLAGGAYLIYQNWDAVKAYMVGLWAEIQEGFSGGIGGIIATLHNFSPIGLLYRAFAGVLSYLGVELPSKFTGFGGMLMDGLVNGITNGLSRVKEAITGAGGATIDWFKEKLGIHSPSRVFAQLGGFTMAGLGQGLANGEGGVLKQIAGTARAMTEAGTSLLTGGITFDSRPPVAAGGGGMVIQGDTVHFTINATPGTDTAGLRQMINQLLDERERGKAARIRSRMSDQD
ncbi:phage tail tape measure protein [Pseudomonas straminea]|uniref:Phage tail tape measure protein, TP901 family, core region n=1 Tax=Pseudomonas straminea TaxID=47882 RepID=A0A1I1WGJ1_PSEOC|nr:phage tail tape measure protein [Pseudomonas straminea]GLX14748.1 phage tail tape measure protein [Pseudomonas straminea]SFD92533.1 phage tail tape measure protein, TP901 family, core region [Pseudomonas straminea]